jgi:hypothetical protein
MYFIRRQRAEFFKKPGCNPGDREGSPLHTRPYKIPLANDTADGIGQGSKATQAGDHKGRPYYAMLRIGLPGPSIVGATLVVALGWGGNRLAHRVQLTRSWLRSAEP